jgi:ATP-binding cassette subfamily B protein
MAIPGVDADDDARSGRDGWALIRDLIVRQRRGISLGIFVGLCWTVGKVAVPLLVRMAIDRGILDDDRTALLRWSAAIAVAGLVAATFTGLRRYLAFRESRWAETILRDRLFAHLQRLHFAFHDSAHTGDLMSRANTDLQQIQHLVVLIPLTVSNAFTVLAVVVILVTIDPVLAVLALGALPFLNVLGQRFSTRLHEPSMAMQRESAELATVVEESVTGVRAVKGFGAEERQSAQLHTEADDLFRESMRAARVRATYLPAMELLPNLGLVAVLGYGGHQVIAGSLTLGSFVAFNAYVGLLIWPLRMLGMIVAQTQRAVVSAQRVHEVLAAAPDIGDPDRPQRLPGRDSGPTGEIVFSAVAFSYAGDDRPVLRDFDLRIEPGETVAFVGPTGSGKSTVGRLVPRFYDVDRGTVRLDGVDVRQIGLQELRTAIGIVFEDTFLFSDTIGANIAFADPDATAEAIEAAARIAGAHEFVAALPEGYATAIGGRGFSLSGGQRQRLAIARAVLAEPRVLILDDATSAVDPTKEHEIRDALTGAMWGRTNIVIAHREATVALADRVVLLDDGRIVAEGTHQDLLATSERYRTVLQSGVAGDEAPVGDLS